MQLYNDAKTIWQKAIQSALPDAAVARALENADFTGGKLVLVAAGKAAWQMAKVAAGILGDKLSGGIVVTKYDHAKGPIPGLEVYEAGHPVPDENSFKATAAATAAVKDLGKGDHVLFLLSGGGSALFEQPLCTPSQLQDITSQLLKCGADIIEINTIRKRLSAVKGGRFAQLCSPAQVFSVVLSDIVGDPLDMIASGPAYPDSSTCEEAVGIAEKYSLKLDANVWELLRQETPKELDNVTTQITGSVRQLCASAEETCRALGYQPLVLTDRLTCIAREAGELLAGLASAKGISDRPLAFIAGGETVVKLTGKGLGGRNQELALAAAKVLDGREGTALFSVGSDGTDGPTDAAGGYVDSTTAERLRQQGISIDAVLADNDSYHALEKVDGLIITGATGTNVNDLAVLLVR